MDVVCGAKCTAGVLAKLYEDMSKLPRCKMPPLDVAPQIGSCWVHRFYAPERNSPFRIAGTHAI